MRWFLLLIAVLAVAGLGWLALEGEAPCPEGDAACLQDRPETCAAGPDRPSIEEVGGPRVPTLLVLGESEADPQVPGEPVLPDAAIMLHPSKGGVVTGMALVCAVAHRVPLRFERGADRDALEGLDDFELTDEEVEAKAVRLDRIVVHWREAGFEFHEMGRALLVTRIEIPPED